MLKKMIAVATLLSLCVVANAQEVDQDGRAAVAERLAKLAQISLSRPDVGDDNFRQAEALLMAACRLSPEEPRFLRLLIEAELQLKNTDAAIQALNRYITIMKHDQVARLQLVDLYLSQMESAEARLKYLTQDIMGNAALSEEFRAAAAVRAARLHLDRDEAQLASAMIDRALDLNPHDPDACILNWARKQHSTSPAERVAAILAMLRANPTNAATMNLLAGELASVGMHAAAQEWYVRAMELAPRSGQAVQPATLLESAMSAFVMGQPKTAESRVAYLVQESPDDFDAQVLNLLCTRRMGAEQPIADALAKATDAVVRRINTIHKELTGQESPTTKPAGELAERIPPVAADAQLLKDKADPALTEAYAEALTELCYITIYFAEKPADAEPLLAALRILLPENSVVLTRLEGWQLLVAGRKDEARAKLTTIAQDDPLSKMGLIRLLAETDKDAAQTEAADLLGTHTFGLLSAILVDAFAELDLRVEPSAEMVNAINAEIAKFPMKWMEILDSPSDFYSLTASAGRVAFQFGEPIIVKVLIKNNGPFDIPLGANGTLRPDLWFDCTVKAAGGAQVPGVAFERFGQKLILRRNETIEHTCRIDQGQLWGQIQSRPEMSFPLYFSVFTNPVPAQAIAAPGPAGYRHSLKLIERQATALMAPNTRNDIFKKLTLGDPATKIRIEEMFAQFASMIGQMPNADQAADTLRQFREAIEQGMTDVSPSVRAWSGYITTLMSAEPRKTQLALKQAGSKDWVQRLIVLATVESLTPDAQQQVLAILVEDEDPAVRQLARATRDYAVRAAATTQPSEEAKPDAQPLSGP